MHSAPLVAAAEIAETSSPLLALAAALPILVLLFLMLVFHWSAARAGVASLAVGGLLALSLFEFHSGYGETLSSLAGFMGTGLEGGFTALNILWIIWPALAIYHLQQETGAMDVLRRALSRITADPRQLALLIAWFFALFLEGAAGFGTSAALAAPFLVGAGFPPLQAVTIVLLGHSVGVSFGAIGTPVIPQIAASGSTGPEIATTTANYHALLGWMIALLVVWFVQRNPPEMHLPDHAEPISPARGGTAWGWALLAAALFIAPMYLLARYVGPELPTLGGALIGAGLFALALRFLGARVAPSEKCDPRSAVLKAGAPYLALVALVAATRLIPPAKAWLAGLTFQWELFETFSGKVQPLYHPGTMLFLGLLIGAACQGALGASLRRAMWRAFVQLGPVTVALLAMLLLSRLMVHSGMIERLALAASGLMGGLWPLAAPFVGVLGTFVTGSATASNILFTDLQLATARQLDLSPLAMMGAQGFGAAVGNIICPHNIVAAAATVGLIGKEAAILRRTIGVCLIYALAGGIAALIIFS